MVPGVELAGRRLGVVGYGAVGRQVAGIARALGMEVVATDPAVREADVPLVDLETLFASSDAVSLHVPLGGDTRGMIGAAELDRMRPHALLVNTSRGGLIDERALAEALASGRIGGAAFDTFEREPPQGSPLLELDNFIARPPRRRRDRGGRDQGRGRRGPRAAGRGPGPVAERSGHAGDHIRRRRRLDRRARVGVAGLGAVRALLH
jgi:hypothetical protein